MFAINQRAKPNLQTITKITIHMYSYFRDCLQKRQALAY